MMSFFTFTLLFVVFGQITFNTFFAEEFYIKTKKEQLLEMYYSITDNYVANHQDIYIKVREYEDKMNLRVFIYNDNYQVVYETSSNDITNLLLNHAYLNHKDRLEYYSFWNPLTYILDSYRNNTESLTVRGSVEHDGIIHYIILEIPLATITEAVETLNGYTLNLSLILLSIGFFFIYVFSSTLSKPISSISQVAKNVANLDFSLKAPVRKTQDEINILAKNINFMADELENSISELKVANKILQSDNDLKQQIDDMRREFIANVSHELKTPLAIMQGYTEILKSDMTNIDRDFYFDVLLDENKHMSELVVKLLSVSKLEENFSKDQFQPLDLVELCSWIVVKNEKLNRDISIKFQSDIENAVVLAEKLRIEQVINNFISNAYNYASSNILVSVSKRNNKFRVTISNDGASILNEDFEKIWNSFYRADKSRTRNEEKNFGLGLYIVKTIISEHDGEVGVYNTDDGVSFWFELCEI